MLVLRMMIKRYLVLLSSVFFSFVLGCATLATVSDEPVQPTHYPGVKKILTINLEQGGITGSCTSFAVAPNKLLTAAHCFVPDNRSEFIGGAVILGGEGTPIFEAVTVEVGVLDCYIQDGYFEPRCDLAVITTNTPVVREEDVLEIDWQPNLNGTIYAVGYPGDGHINRQIISEGVLTSGEGYLYSFSALVVGGMSGGPVIKDGKVVGVTISRTSEASFAVALPEYRSNLSNMWK